MKTTVTLVPALALLAACASGDWKAADTALNTAAAGIRAAGYAPLPGRNNDFGAFTEGGAYEWAITLGAGADVVIGAACAPGCSTLDLRVTAPGGTVTEDTTSGAVPFVPLIGADSGSYRVSVRYGPCDAGRECRWVSQVYGRRPERR